MARTIITVCETCRRGDTDPDAVRDGAIFAELIESCAAPVDHIDVKRFRCLAGCDEACNLSVQQSGKYAYLFGRFEPMHEKAEAVVKFAELYHASEDGVVPLRDRPDALRGHMRGKMPILD